MKKIIIAFLLGNALVVWLITRFAKWFYRVNPEAHKYIWNEIIVPAFKNALVDTLESMDRDKAEE